MTDYEKVLASHIAKLEEHASHRLILLQNQNTSMGKVRDSKRGLQKSLLSEIAKLSAEIDLICLESEPEVDLQILERQKQEHENDVQLLLHILERVYSREKRTGNS